jgi:exocyst complex component 7
MKQGRKAALFGFVEDGNFSVNKMMAAELVKQCSNITLGEKNEICDIKHALKALRKKILSLDFENSIHVHDPQDSFEYLEVLCKIRQLYGKLSTLDPGTETKQLDELTVYADDLSGMALTRLEEDFAYLLTHYRQFLEHEHLSFSSTEDGSAEEFSSSSFSEEHTDGKTTQSDTSKNQNILWVA